MVLVLKPVQTDVGNVIEKILIYAIFAILVMGFIQMEPVFHVILIAWEFVMLVIQAFVYISHMVTIWFQVNQEDAQIIVSYVKTIVVFIVWVGMRSQMKILNSMKNVDGLQIVQKTINNVKDCVLLNVKLVMMIDV